MTTYTTYTTSPTETLSLGDVVVMGGKKYHVRECMCGRNFTLADSSNVCVSEETECQTLKHITEFVRQEFAKLAPKEVPPLAVGQTWRTRCGDRAVIETINDHPYATRKWWYKNHLTDKSAHSPGVFGNDHRDTLVELIADAPEKSPTKDEVALVLSREEAQFLRSYIGDFLCGIGPSRKIGDAIHNKLVDLGVLRVTRSEYNLSFAKRGGIAGIWCDEVKEPLFRLGEVWRTEKKYLVRVCMVRSDGAAFVRTIHNPKDAAILYGDEGTREVSADGDILASCDKLVEKISD